MVQTTNLMNASRQTLRKTQETLWDIPRVVISAEERLRQRVRSALRVTIATLFIGISGLISLGANVTMAIAKKVSPDVSSKRSSENIKRAKEHHRKGASHRFHLRHSSELLTTPSEPNTVMTSSDETASSDIGGSKLISAKSVHGTASWYGGKFQHRKTASGANFNTHSMTAAHRTLPFGTKVLVTNLANHKSCVVEITDRGPYIGSRLIDVSHAAALKLDMTGTGTAKVAIQVLPSASVDELALLTPEASSRSASTFDNLPQASARNVQSLVRSNSELGQHASASE